jgi:hypothetical protein
MHKGISKEQNNGAKESRKEERRYRQSSLKYTLCRR